MLSLALNRLNEMGINKVLVTCAAENIGSIRTILANGGVFENEVCNEYGELVRRFWIHCEGE